MQHAFSFDRETVRKIAVGAILSFLGAGSIAALNYLGAIEIDNPALAAGVSWIVPCLANAIKEFTKGV